MKLPNRLSKGIVAAGTALALTTGSVVAAPVAAADSSDLAVVGSNSASSIIVSALGSVISGIVLIAVFNMLVLNGQIKGKTIKLPIPIPQ